MTCPGRCTCKSTAAQEPPAGACEVLWLLMLDTVGRRPDAISLPLVEPPGAGDNVVSVLRLVNAILRAQGWVIAALVDDVSGDLTTYTLLPLLEYEAASVVPEGPARVSHEGP